MGPMGRMGPMIMGQWDYGTNLWGTMGLWDKFVGDYGTYGTHGTYDYGTRRLWDEFVGDYGTLGQHHALPLVLWRRIFAPHLPQLLATEARLHHHKRAACATF